jgi:hypothetical protein
MLKIIYLKFKKKKYKKLRKKDDFLLKLRKNSFEGVNFFQNNSYLCVVCIFFTYRENFKFFKVNLFSEIRNFLINFPSKILSPNFFYGEKSTRKYTFSNRVSFYKTLFSMKFLSISMEKNVPNKKFIKFILEKKKPKF